MAARAERRCRSRGGRPAAAPTAAASSSSIRSAARRRPRARVTEPHSGQARGSGSAWPQWWQRRPSPAAVDDQRDVAVRAPQRPARRSGRSDTGAQPRRLMQHDRLAAAAAQRGERRPRARVKRSRAAVAPAHVEHLDRRHRAPVDALAAARAARARASSPAAGSRCRARARRRSARRAGGRPRGRRSAGRPPACRRRRAPRRRRSGRGRRSARRPPSAARRRSAPRRRAAGATRRGARRLRGASAAPRRESPKRATKRETACGVSPISGTSDDRPAAALERRLDGGEVDLGLARAGDAVQEQLRRRPPSSAATIRSSARALRRVERDRPAAGADRGAARAPAHLALAELDQAAALEPAQRVAGDPRRGRARRRRARPRRRRAARARAAAPVRASRARVRPRPSPPRGR